jgi:hypothetical protein
MRLPFEISWNRRFAEYFKAEGPPRPLRGHRSRPIGLQVGLWAERRRKSSDHREIVVNRNGITIEASLGAVLDGQGLAGETGIHVMPFPKGASIKGFRLRGPTFTGNSVLTEHGRDFVVSAGTYLGTANTASSPSIARMDASRTTGFPAADDTAIYVGQSATSSSGTASRRTAPSVSRSKTAPG